MTQAVDALERVETRVRETFDDPRNKQCDGHGYSSNSIVVYAGMIPR